MGLLINQFTNHPGTPNPRTAHQSWNSPFLTPFLLESKTTENRRRLHAREATNTTNVNTVGQRIVVPVNVRHTRWVQRWAIYCRVWSGSFGIEKSFQFAASDGGGRVGCLGGWLKLIGWGLRLIEGLIGRLVLFCLVMWLMGHLLWLWLVVFSYFNRRMSENYAWIMHYACDSHRHIYHRTFQSYSTDSRQQYWLNGRQFEVWKTIIDWLRSIQWMTFSRLTNDAQIDFEWTSRWVDGCVGGLRRRPIWGKVRSSEWPKLWNSIMKNVLNSQTSKVTSTIKVYRFLVI